MSKKHIDRINVFTELVGQEETFDYEKCEKLLGDNYDSFVNFCQAIRIIPEEISHMSVVSFPDNNHDPVKFIIELVDGNKISLEK